MAERRPPLLPSNINSMPLSFYSSLSDDQPVRVGLAGQGLPHGQLAQLLRGGRLVRGRKCPRRWRHGRAAGHPHGRAARARRPSTSSPSRSSSSRAPPRVGSDAHGRGLERGGYRGRRQLPVVGFDGDADTESGKHLHRVFSSVVHHKHIRSTSSSSSPVAPVGRPQHGPDPTAECHVRLARDLMPPSPARRVVVDVVRQRRGASPSRTRRHHVGERHGTAVGWRRYMTSALSVGNDSLTASSRCLRQAVCIESLRRRRVTISAAPTTTTVTANPNPNAYGTSPSSRPPSRPTRRSTATPTRDGDLQERWSTSRGCVGLALSSGAANCTLSGLAGGSYSVTAV